MAATRTFPTLDVVSVTTGFLVSDRGMDAIYDVLDYLLDDNLATHQLPAASTAATPDVYRQHPWMATLNPPRGDKPALKAWSARLVEERGETVDLAPAVGAVWRSGNAMQDLMDLAGGRPVVAVDAP